MYKGDEGKYQEGGFKLGLFLDMVEQVSLAQTLHTWPTISRDLCFSAQGSLSKEVVCSGGTES